MGTLYVVGTPIGNLEDITLRAIRTLREVELIAAEDTRVTRTLLNAHEISTPLVSFHEFSGPARVRQRLQSIGIDADTVREAVAETFQDVDEDALLDAALGRRLRGQALDTLDERARARLIRALVGQGFSLSAVLKRVRS